MEIQRMTEIPKTQIQWREKIKKEIKINNTAIIIYIKLYTLNKGRIRASIKKLAKEWTEKNNHKIKYWLITEPNIKKGTTEIHGMVWNTTPEELKKIWNNGEIHTKPYIKEKTINYLVKYIDLEEETQIITRKLK